MLEKPDIIIDVDEITAFNENNEGLKKEFNSHKVGKILSFDKIRKTVTVQLLEKVENIQGLFDFPILEDVILNIAGANDSHLTFGNVVGEECLVHFNDTDIDNWFSTGEAYLPNTPRRHNLSDGFAEISVNNLTKVWTYDDGGTVLNKGDTFIKLTGSTIQMTNGSCNFMMDGDTITITGKLVVSDNITGQKNAYISNGLYVYGNEGGSGQFTGNIIATGTITGQTDVIAGGKSGKSHTHTCPSGGGTSSSPN